MFVINFRLVVITISLAEITGHDHFITDLDDQDHFSHYVDDVM